jgi:AraC-like DNA-binding protein
MMLFVLYEENTGGNLTTRNVTSQFVEDDSLKTSAPGNARVGPIMALPLVLEDLGINSREAFEKSGVDFKIFSDANNRIPFQQLGRLVELSVELTQCEHFGLLVGERFDLKGLGLIGHLMRNSPSVGEALHILLQSLHLHDQGAALILLELDNNCVLLGYSIYQHETPGSAQIYDGAIAIIFRILCQLCGPEWKAHQVQFSHRPPSKTIAFRNLFRSPVLFDAELSGIVFDGAWMKRPIKGRDPALYTFLSNIIKNVDAQNCALVKDKVKRVLRQMLLSGKFSGSEIAQLFGMHERTLRRRLNEEETNLQELVNQTRFELAKELLKNTVLAVSEIASILQYKDTNAFSRAFRNWANLSPIQWRNNEGD